MEEETATCPNCSSNKVERIKDKSFVCWNCKSKFELSDPADSNGYTDSGEYAEEEIYDFDDYFVWGLTDFGESLETLRCPNPEHSIRIDAFAHHRRLKKFIIDKKGNPGKDNRVYFCGCSALSEIIIDSPNTIVSKYSFTRNIGDQDHPLDLIKDYPNLKLNEYKNCYYFGNPSNPYYLLLAVKFTSLKNYEIHEDTKVIGASAFSRCINITDITIPKGVEVLGASAFYGCTSLRSIIIPDGVKVIESYVFSQCSQLSTVYMPDSIDFFGESVFKDCVKLEFNVDSGVKYLGNADNPYLFLFDARDFAGKSFKCNPATKVLGAECFSKNELEEIILSSALVKICNNAFSKITKQKALYIPRGLKIYDIDGVLQKFVDLESIEVEEGNNFYQSINGVLYNSDLSRLLYIPPKYRGELIMPDAVKHVSGYYYSSPYITKVTLSDNLENARDFIYPAKCPLLEYNEYDNAYYLGSSQNPYFMLVKPVSTNVKSLKIHNETKSISYCAFDKLQNLEVLYIPKSIGFVSDEIIDEDIFSKIREVYLEDPDEWTYFVPDNLDPEDKPHFVDLSNPEDVAWYFRQGCLSQVPIQLKSIKD